MRQTSGWSQRDYFTLTGVDIAFLLSSSPLFSLVGGRGKVIYSLWDTFTKSVEGNEGCR